MSEPVLDGSEPVWGIWRKNAARVRSGVQEEAALASDMEAANGALEVALEVPGAGLVVVGMRRYVEQGWPADPRPEWVATRLPRSVARLALIALAAELGVDGAKLVGPVGVERDGDEREGGEK